MPDPETFELPTSGIRGRSTRIALEESALAWHGANGPCRHPFDEIAAVELEADSVSEDPFARCDIIFTDGERLKLIITSDAAHAREIEAFRGFLFHFVAALSPEQRTRIQFREGVGAVKRIAGLIVSGGGTVAFIGIIIWLAASGEYAQDNQFLLFPLALVFIAMLSAVFVLLLKSGRKPFDPMNIPERALPAVPRKRGT